MNTHPIYCIGIESSAAKLILTPCPGTQSVSLQSSLKQLSERGAAAVVTLMTSAELRQLSFDDFGQHVKANGMSWFHLPIEDEHCPDSHFMSTWQSAGPAIHRLLEKQKSVVIHCKGGSGRTGMIAAQLLIERGEPLAAVMKHIKKLRPNAFKLAHQQNYIYEVEQALVLA